MKRILVFRSSSYNILGLLTNFLDSRYGQNYSLTIIAQKEAINYLKNQYPNAILIETTNGFFKYEEYTKNNKLREKIEKNKYDEIYIPSSTQGIKNLEELQLICTKICSDYIYVFDCTQNIYEINYNKLYKKIKKFYKYILSPIESIVLLIILNIILKICIIYSDIIHKEIKKC